MARKAMDFLYRASEALAALCIFLITAMIFIQVLLGIMDQIARVLGFSVPGLSIPSYADLAGFLLAGGIFLGLAATLKVGGHVRVNLLLKAVSDRLRQRLSIVGTVFAMSASGYFTWRAGAMAHESWLFGDLSFGQIAVPMWIPQSVMVIGLAMLTLAFLDLLLSLLRGEEDLTARVDSINSAG